MTHKFYIGNVNNSNVRVLKIHHNNRWEALKIASQRIRQNEYITNKDERFNN